MDDPKKKQAPIISLFQFSFAIVGVVLWIFLIPPLTQPEKLPGLEAAPPGSEDPSETSESLHPVQNSTYLHLQSDPSRPEHSTTGFYLLTWNQKEANQTDNHDSKKRETGNHEDPVYTVYEFVPHDKTGRVVYTGKDTAMTMSGKPDGVYSYRVQTDYAKSNTIQVQVSHHPMSRALTFLSVGGIVFFLTAGLILFGQKAPAGRSEDA